MIRKTLSTQSLSNFRRESLSNIATQIKQSTLKNKASSKSRIPSPIVKTINLSIKNDQNVINTHKTQLKKNDIQQIYQYKIKQRAKNKKSKLYTQQQQLIQPFASPSQINLQDSKFINSLKLQNQKMTKELYDLSKQNKKLKQLLVIKSNNFQSKNIRKQNEKTKNQKDYKQQVLTRLNDRQRLKTQLDCIKQSNIMIANQKKDRQKSSSLKQKIKSYGSKNNITMNLNMSFVKLKSPSNEKNIVMALKQQAQRSEIKPYIPMLNKSNSRKSLHSKDNSLKSPKFQPQHSKTIKQIFNEYMLKKQISGQDLSSFYELNKKIFSQFNQMIIDSKRVYSELLNKINLNECYDSKKIQSSITKNSKLNNAKKVQQTIKLMQDLYKSKSIVNINSNEVVEFHQTIASKKFHTQSLQQETNQTPSSSVISFTEAHNNPQRQKSYQKYRLKKLNENLDLLSKFQNKKIKTDISQTKQDLQMEPKVYFSKPVSTNISRKISFNNSLNNSLKNSKFCQ